MFCLLASLHLSVPFIEGRQPQVHKIRPYGDYVCGNIDTILVCSFDEPENVVSVVWNIPESANVDLNSFAGHEVNSAMMSEGNITVTINDFSLLREFYECNVLYSGPRSLEVSSRYQKNPSTYYEHHV